MTTIHKGHEWKLVEIPERMPSDEAIANPSPVKMCQLVGQWRKECKQRKVQKWRVETKPTT